MKWIAPIVFAGLGLGLGLSGCTSFPTEAPGCTEDAACGDGERCTGTCDAVPPGSACIDRSDCGNGQRCGAAACSPVPLGNACVEDSDCGNLQRCGDQACVPEPPPGGCVDDRSCADGTHCVAAACAPVVGDPATCPAPPLSEELRCNDWDPAECPCYAGTVTFHEKDEGGRLTCAGVTGIFSQFVYLKQDGCHLTSLDDQVSGDAVGFGELRLRIAKLPDDSSCSAQPDQWIPDGATDGRPAVRITCSATCKIWMEQLSATGEERIVPGGAFTMGTPPDLLPVDRPEEGPEYLVDLGCFWIDRFEVSRGDYQRCLEVGTCQPPNYAGAGQDARRFFGAENTRLPMTFLTWQQAEAFCKFNEKDLPTEAEWEAAARSDPTSYEPWPWGATPPFTPTGGPDCVGAVFEGCGDGPEPVGPYAADRGRGPSYYGVADLGGNVREWVRDYYKDDAYALRAASSGSAGIKDPEQVAPGRLGEVRVVRGGGYLSQVDRDEQLPSDALRAAARDHEPQNAALPDLGFRCVRRKPQLGR